MLTWPGKTYTMKSLLPFLCSCLLRAACNSKTKPAASPTQSTSEKEALSQPDVAVTDMPDDDLARNFVGLYRERDGKLEFVPCEAAEKSYWVLGNTERLTSLYESATRQGYPGQYVVASVKGMLRKPSPSRGAAMASPYTAQLEVSEVVEVRPKNFRNTCIPYEFWALGNEPFWSLQISAAENVVEFSQLGSKTISAKYVKPTTDAADGPIRYYIPFDNGQRMKVTVMTQSCEDSMAGNKYPYTVELEYNGQTYSGCATDQPL